MNDSSSPDVRPAELQADFLAGVWLIMPIRQFDILEDGDVEEAIQARNQIGDDTLQKEATGRVILNDLLTARLISE